MEFPKSPQNDVVPRESASDQETPSERVSLFLRLWSYGGPSQPPVGLPLEQHAEVAELITSIIREGKGEIANRQPELWAAHFDDALYALSTAKTLQQRFLTSHRKTEPQQVVPSILIYTGITETKSSPDAAAPEDMLANVTSAQILIAESIYERVKNAPGFKFNPNPVREAGETFGPDAIYELLWTDESTYGHLRQASRAGLMTVGRYQIQEELGRGAMGAVYKAYDELIGRMVALKTISIDRSAPDRDELVERLKQEAKAAGGLDHPNIITIYDVGEEDDVVYLSMQFVKGITLARLLAEMGVPSLSTFLSWADQISSAVAFAHSRGVVHRDLKPANLMVTEQGVIKVLDFGIAKIGNTSLTQTGLIVGTPSYMAPEQVAGKKTDHRADIFSLGSVFYELVTREKPFRGDVTTILYKIVQEEPVAPSLINPSIPGGVDAIIRKALAKDPKERFQTCDDMRKAILEQASRIGTKPAVLAPVATAAPSPEQRPSPPLPSFLLSEAPPERSRRVWPALAAVLMLALIATSSWALYVRSRTGTFPAFVNTMMGRVDREVQSFHDLSHRPNPDPGQTPGGGPGSQNSVLSHSDGAGTQPAPNSVALSPAQTAPGISDTPALPSPGNAVKPAGSQPEEAQAPTATSSAPPVPAQVPSTVSLQQISDKQSAATGGATNAPAIVEGSSNSSDSEGSEENHEGSQSSLDTKAPTTLKRPAPRTVDGFTRKNVPDLLRLADVAARRGDYRLARYEYNLVLKLDEGNLTARKGLRLIQAERSLH